MSTEADSPVFSVDSLTHRALGPLTTLRVGNSPTLRLTPQEARTLGLALAAVRDGRSAEREIYLSPIASDDGFCAQVGTTGIEVEIGASREHLGWALVGRLVAHLLPG